MKKVTRNISLTTPVVVCGILFLLFCSSMSPLIGGASKDQHPVSMLYSALEKSSEGDVPTWYQGDEWVYKIDPLTFSSPNVSFSGTIQNFKHKVLGITAGVYNIQLTGTISGTLLVNGISGQLTGQITGSSKVRVSDLADISTELHSQGTIMIIILPVPYELHLLTNSSPPLELFDFPLALNEQWQLSSTTTTTGSFIIQGYVDQSLDGTQFIDETVQCTQKKQVTVPAGVFESYEITRSDSSVWYSTDVGNIVKSIIQQNDVNLTIQATLSLQSFSRNPQPLTVLQNIQPFKVIPGASVVISGQATNTGTGNPVQNAAITLSIPSTGDSWSTTTDSSGYYSKTIVAPTMSDDTPSGRETGSGGIIVQCSSGGLNGYRVQSLVTMHDTPPTAPSITGPSSGKANVAYDYSFVATDAENDEVFYFINWGDGTNSSWVGPYNANAPITMTHTYAKKGSYTITARAKDIYHAESAWGSFDVTMPTHGSMTLLHHFLEQLLCRFPLIRYIFALFG